MSLSPVGDVAGDVASPTPPAAIIRRRRPDWRVRREAESCSIAAHPNASPPLLLLKRKADVSPWAPLKPVRRNEFFFRDPYQAAIHRQRAASVAAALEHAFSASEMTDAEGVIIEDFLIDLTGVKLAKTSL